MALRYVFTVLPPTDNLLSELFARLEALGGAPATFRPAFFPSHLPRTDDDIARFLASTGNAIQYVHTSFENDSIQIDYRS